MLPAQLRPPPTFVKVWHWLTEPAPTVTQPSDRRNARLIAALFLMALVMMLVVRLFRTVAHVPESAFNINTFGINMVVICLCYVLSRTRYYRAGIIIAFASVMTVLYVQSIYRAYSNPMRMTDSTVWAVGVILIGGLVVSWQLMLLLSLIYTLGLLALPTFVPNLSIYDVRFSIEFVIGMTALITVTAVLRQRDLERIKQQTTDLMVSESRYRTLLEAGFEALIIHDDGLILDLNDAVLTLTGYTSPDQLIGRRTIELVTPDARSMVDKLYQEHSKEALVYQTAIQHANGQRVEIEARSRTITYQGQQVRVIAFRDITQLKQSSEQVKNLFDNLDRVFYSFSAVTGQVLQISSACEKLYGYAPKDFYDDISLWARIVHPDDLLMFMDDLREVTREQNSLRPFRIVRKNGEVRWVEMLITPVYNAANELTRYDGLVADITERRQIETERERSLVLRQFITDASHDLRTPLATLYTSLYLLRRVAPAEENISRYLSTLETQTAHLSRVLDDLFTMSRLDSPESYVEKNRLDINQVMDNVISAQKPLANKKQLHLIYLPAEPPFDVPADKDYLLVALNHVVNNAVQYTPDKGRITIRVAAPHPKEAEIEIQDTGIGIQPTEMPYIFDRFYRSDRARKTDSGGVGLGLSLARKIVEVHEGRIEAESTPGEGSTFRITLPLMLK